MGWPDLRAGGAAVGYPVIAAHSAGRGGTPGVGYSSPRSLPSRVGPRDQRGLSSPRRKGIGAPPTHRRQRGALWPRPGAPGETY
eukprot:2617497-Pyramimonas_sp.AAC.1